MIVKNLALAFGASHEAIHFILHNDLGLSKKPAKWVPMLKNDSRRRSRSKSARIFFAAFNHLSKAMLGNIVIMDETTVCYHNPKMKKQSKQWIKMGKLDLSRVKQTVKAFFNVDGLIYTHFI